MGLCIDRLATTPDQAAALLATPSPSCTPALTSWPRIGRRTWEPSPDMPALVIVIDEYAELADEVPDAMATPTPSPALAAQSP